MVTRFGRVQMDGIVKRHGAFTALHGLDLEIEPGEFFALLGPSGSGKTTTLRILAGLEEVNHGRVLLDDVDVTHKEPGERDVAMVFQSYALYPHMTVGENIAFPLKMVGTPAAEIAAGVRDAAARVDIGHLLARRPGQLSGGQQQRCALARAIVRKPRLFLLDEPLSNLDAKLRIETRAELRKLQRSLGVTTVYVTHDQEEAMTVADRMAVFMDGRIVQIGTPKEIFLRPANVTVAAFIGTPPMNLLPAQLQDGHVILQDLRVPIEGYPQERKEVTLGVRPTDLRIAEPSRSEPGFEARVEFIEDLGDNVIINFDVLGRRVKVRRDRAPDVAEGQVVRLAFEPAAAHLFDAGSGARLNAATDAPLAQSIAIEGKNRQGSGS
jgi:multiple sugar transport system ATP-binding protein